MKILTSRQFIIALLLNLVLTSFECHSQTDTARNKRQDDYPFTVNYLEFNVQKNIYKMAYMFEKPSRPNGKTVVLLHGKNFNGAYWETSATALLKNGYAVVIPDQIGFGKSSKPEFYQYTFQRLALNTKILLDSLKIRSAIILGHSMGGMLAIRFALMYPEFTEKLILEDPIGLEDYKLKVPFQFVDDMYQKELKQNYESLKKYQKENYYHGEWKPEYERWLNFLVEQTKQDDYTLIAKNNALTTDMIMNQPVVYELQNIETPTLLIIGELDKTAPGKDLVAPDVAATMGNYKELGEKSHALIKNSKLVTIGNTGHLPHIESFDKFIVPVLDFVSKNN